MHKREAQDETDLRAFLLAFVPFVAIFLYRDDFHLTLGGFDGEVDAIVDGDAVQQACVGHRKFHLHCGHQAIDVLVIDFDRRAFGD